MRYIFALFLASFTLATIATASEQKKNNSAFVATKEWQTVQKGTPLPAGLHIRHNLETGVTEAKLMTEEEKQDQPEKKNPKENSLTIHPEKSYTEGEINEVMKEKAAEEMKIPFDELKAMLKKMKSDENEQQTSETDQAQPERRKKFRSYSELKEELEALNMNVTTDSELLTNLFKQFESYKESITRGSLESSKAEDIIEIINNIEYLIHQIDNARTFTDLGGMGKIISPSLNSTNSEIKAEALKLLGAAVQSNPRVQLKALESDFVQKLLHMLTTNNKVEVKSRCLFALGALVRHFPAAQKALVNHGGLEIFGKILADGPYQIQMRVMNLINDLTIERKNLKEIIDEIQRLKRTHEYESTNFEEKLVMQNYCKNLADLTLKSLKTNSEIDEFYEVIYENMIILSSICKNDFLVKKDELLPEIQRVMDKYRESPERDEDGENVYAYHLDLLEKIDSDLKKKQEAHDEL